MTSTVAQWKAQRTKASVRDDFDERCDAPNQRSPRGKAVLPRCTRFPDRHRIGTHHQELRGTVAETVCSPGQRADPREDALALPGEEIVAQGLADLAAGQESIPALLVAIASPALQVAGITVPTTVTEPNLRLYRLLQLTHGDAAHSQYNALIRRMVSYQRALQCAR